MVHDETICWHLYHSPPISVANLYTRWIFHWHWENFQPDRSAQIFHIHLSASRHFFKGVRVSRKRSHARMSFSKPIACASLQHSKRFLGVDVKVGNSQETLGYSYQAVLFFVLKYTCTCKSNQVGCKTNYCVICLFALVISPHSALLSYTNGYEIAISLINYSVCFQP